MKLRIKGNSLRLRLTRSEVAHLAGTGRIDETVHFGPGPEARLTYALEHNTNASAPEVVSRQQEVVIVLPTGVARTWATGETVGIYATVDLGANGKLELVVEKDFACLDLSDAENADTFPNPNLGAVC